MKQYSIVAAVLAGFLGSGAIASAQSLNNDDIVNERVDAIAESVEDKFALSEDANRGGNPDFAPGWRGSLYASADLTSGNTDTTDLSIGARVTGGFGPWNQTVSLAYDYGETNGTKSKNELFALYDVNRNLSDRFYVYGLARANNDYLNNDQDLFVGFGPGYRIFNTEQLAWRVQAGPGYRVSDIFGSGDVDEAGVSASSRFFYAVSETLDLTNDTDVLWSDAGTLVTNDIGLTWDLTGPLSARVGFKSDYNSNPSAGQVDMDTTTGVALIVSF